MKYILQLKSGRFVAGVNVAHRAVNMTSSAHSAKQFSSPAAAEAWVEKHLTFGFPLLKAVRHIIKAPLPIYSVFAPLGSRYDTNWLVQARTAREACHHVRAAIARRPDLLDEGAVGLLRAHWVRETGTEFEERFGVRISEVSGTPLCFDEGT